MTDAAGNSFLHEMPCGFGRGGKLNAVQTDIFRKKEGKQFEQKISAGKAVPRLSEEIEPGATGHNELKAFLVTVEIVLQDIFPFGHLVNFIEAEPLLFPFCRTGVGNKKIRVCFVKTPCFSLIPVVVKGLGTRFFQNDLCQCCFSRLPRSRDKAHLTAKFRVESDIFQ